jgi:hypothetical protein
MLTAFGFKVEISFRAGLFYSIGITSGQQTNSAAAKGQSYHSRHYSGFNSISAIGRSDG